MQSGIAQNVYTGLVEKIATGVYPKGSFIPSCRVLAKELGVNKNTVNKAIKMLQARDIVRPIPGVGSMVVGNSHGLQPDTAANEIAAGLDKVMHMARVTGLSRKQAEHLAKSAVEKWFGRTQVAALLVECNKWDAASLADHIRKQLSIQVVPMVIEEFLPHAPRIAEGYDIVMTTFYHLSELYRALPPGERDRVVGLQDKPRVDALVALSRIPNETRIGLVAGHNRTLDLIQGTLRSCGYPVAERALIEDTKSITRMFGRVDLLVTSEVCQHELFELRPSVPVITISFEVDQQSLEFLRKKLSSIIGLKSSEACN